jgi:hypothetical protein
MSSSKNKIYISTKTPEKTRELYKKHKSIPTKHKYQSNTFYPRAPNNIFSNNSKGFQFGGFKRRSHVFGEPRHALPIAKASGSNSFRDEYGSR